MLLVRTGVSESPARPLWTTKRLRWSWTTPLCTLTLTSLVTSESGKTTYTASPSITLGASYAGSASTFSSGSGTAFYGNAMLSATGFASNFTVDILYSDNPNNSAQQNLTGAWASVTASSATTVNSAPNYTFSFGSLAICTDNAFTVEGSCSSGSATVSPASSGPVYGDHYCVDSSLTTASPTFTQVDTAYAGTSCTTTKTTISGNSAFNVAESSFSLTSLSTSPVYRTVIVHNSTSGVNSYQTFFIAFTQP